jgi:hypothetical protein
MVQGGYGVVFAVRVQILWLIRVSRYKFYRSREVITRYKFNDGHWRDRGISFYKSVLGAGAKAKTMTSPLIIPSVLAFRAYYFIISLFLSLLVLVQVAHLQ